MRDDANHWKSFGRWLRAQREARSITKQAAARRSGLSVSSWHNYEAGGRYRKDEWVIYRPSPDNLEAIATALGIEAEEVYDRAGVVPVNRPESRPETRPEVTGVEGELRRLRSEQAELRLLLRSLLDRIDELTDSVERGPVRRRP